MGVTIGRYRFRTNGTEWTAYTVKGQRIVTRLPVIIQEWETIHDAASDPR